MIIAIDTNKAQINLFEFTNHDEIVKLKKKGPYYCPVCLKKVRLKTGIKRRAHFAHIHLDECVNERQESKLHIDGKYDLYHFFKRYSTEVLVEQLIPKINQRPDLIVKLNDQKLIIEYQCSKIPLEVIQQRTNGYRMLGLKGLWILGGNLLQQKSRYTFSLNSLSIYTSINTEHPVILFYDSSTKTFKILSSIIAFSTNIVVGKLSEIKIETAHLQNLLVHSTIYKKDFINTWLYLKASYRKKQHLNYKGDFYELKTILYELQIYYLPAIIGVPLSSNHVLRQHCIVWQGMLYFLFIHPVKIEDMINLDDLKSYLIQRITSGEWQVNDFQFNRKINMENCVENYIDFLEQFRIVKRKKNGKIMKIANAIIPSSFQQALDEDCLSASTAFELLFHKTTDLHEH